MKETLIALFCLLPIQCGADELDPTTRSILSAVAGPIPSSEDTRETPKPWRLVTQLNNGRITVSRYETKEQCDDAKQRAQHQPMTLEEKAYSLYFQKRDSEGHKGPPTYMLTATDIDNIECLDW